MTNDYSSIPAESEFRDNMTQTAEEFPMDLETPFGEQLDGGFDDELVIDSDEGGLDDREQDCDSVGWPGDGSGIDDFADFNANEAFDYSNE